MDKQATGEGRKQEEPWQTYNSWSINWPSDYRDQ